MKLEEYIQELSKRFADNEVYFGHGTDNSYDEAAYLVFGVLGLDHNDDIESLSRELTKYELDILERKAEQRIGNHIPVAYIIGEAWFAGLKFFSDTRALIPRSPIAELIENKFEPLLEEHPVKILDLCTGSGCIGIATAKSFKDSQVDISDNDRTCLDLAEKNIAFHGLSGRVRPILSNLFENITDKYDLIICNPPYVSKEEYDDLPNEYSHEPCSGLISEDSGLAVSKRVLYEASEYLSKNGRLVMEVGFSDQELVRCYPGAPFLWLDFDRGGRGVFMLTAVQLAEFFQDLN